MNIINTLKTMSRKILPMLGLVGLLATQTACSEMVAGLIAGALGGGVNTTFQTGNTGSTGGTGSGATDDGGGLLDDGDDDNQVLPQSSLPSPPGLNNSSLSLPDSNGIAVAQGNLGEDYADYKLILSRNALATASLQRSVNLVANAYADTDCPDDISYDACVDIEADGSFIASVEAMEADTTLNYYFYDPESGAYSEATTDSPLENLVHLSHKFISVTMNNDTLFGVSTTGKVVKLVYNDEVGRLEVSGDYDDDYLVAAFDESVSSFIYNPNEDTFIFLNSDGEASEHQLDESAANFPPTGRDASLECYIGDGCHVNNMKLVGTNLYFGAWYEEGNYQTIGNLFEFYDGSTANTIEFMPSSLGYTLAEIKAFDVWYSSALGNHATVNIIENGDGDFMIFGKFNHTLSPRFDSYSYSLATEAYTDIYDLTVLEEQSSSDLDQGRAIFLSDVGLTFFDFDIVNRYSGQSVTLGPDININNAVAMATNTDETKAYVLSSGNTSSVEDDIITVVDLDNEIVDTSIGTNGVITLSDLLNGKDVLDLSPQTITFFSQDGNDYLFIGLNNTDDAFQNSGLIIEL